MTQVDEGMAAVMKAITPIAKTSGVGVNYTFRGVDDVFNHLHGLLADQGLWLEPRLLDDWQVNMIAGTKNRMQAQALFRLEVDVKAADGSITTLGPGLAQSHDYGDKAVYQAQQNALKYLLIEAFAIPTGELDMDEREADAVTPDHGKWLADAVQIFKSWDEPERKEAYKSAMTELDIDTLDSMDDARRIFEHMTGLYYEAFPDTATF